MAEGVSGLLADDQADLARQIARIATDAPLRDRLTAGALQHAGNFTWDATATKIMEILVDEALGRPGLRRPGTAG
jgi:hypothetical protein